MTNTLKPSQDLTPPVDPKTEITPYAFQVDPSLLGLPLARPARRLFAFLFDALLISIMSPLLMLLLFFVMTGYLKGRDRAMGLLKRAIYIIGIFILVMVGLIQYVINEASISIDVKDAAEQIEMAIEEQKKAAAKEALTPNKTQDDTGKISEQESGKEASKDDIIRFASVIEKAVESAEESKGEKEKGSTKDASPEEEKFSIIAAITGLANDLGITVGSLGLYFTLALFYWNGQTIGKKLMRIRVVRLNGEKISAWHAFERFGGYAAGVSTGLLGFLQVYWDPNRQAIHDKICGTVVINDTEKLDFSRTALNNTHDEA